MIQRIRKRLLIGTAWLICLVAASADSFGDDRVQLDAIIAESEQARIAAVERAMPSTVSIFVPGGAGGGSGVLISPDGYALTNFHVTSPAGSHLRCGLSDGKIYDAVIVGVDPVGDLALIRLLGRDDFPAAEFGNSLIASPGDWCMVIGNPFLLASNLQPTVSWGILSGVGRYQYPSGTLLEYGDCLQTDAAINPGNSGGPLFDAEGRLLGIVGRASFEKRGRVNVGVGYAISIHQAKNFLGYLHSGRVVDHATLGATVATDPDGSVRVTNILENSDAYRRGLRYGAEILEINGRPVQNANDVQKVLATLPSDWRVKLVFRHEGETVETLVRLRSVHQQDELLKKMSAALPPPPPRPEEKPGEDGPGEGDPHHEARPAESGDGQVPPEVAAQFEAREGYANYHFNRVQQERFIDSLRQQFPGGSAGDASGWTIEGETDEAQPRPVRLRVEGGEMAMVVGDETMEAKTKGELYDLVQERSLGGMLAALDAWRRMIAAGPKKFGATHYQGTMPLSGERPLRHSMIGLDGALEIRWLRHPESGRVEAVEALADPDRDPAEVWVLRGEGDSDAAPAILDLRYGVESVLRVRVHSWEKTPAGQRDTGGAGQADNGGAGQGEENAAAQNAGEAEAAAGEAEAAQGEAEAVEGDAATEDNR